MYARDNIKVIETTSKFETLHTPTDEVLLDDVMMM